MGEDREEGTWTLPWMAHGLGDWWIGFLPGLLEEY